MLRVFVLSQLGMSWSDINIKNCSNISQKINMELYRPASKIYNISTTIQAVYPEVCRISVQQYLEKIVQYCYV